MSKGTGAQKDLFANSGTGDTIANTSMGNAASLYGTAVPALTAEATAPAGIAAPDLAKMTTSAEQSAGGSNAGAVGQGSLLAARTKNAGTADAAIAKSAEKAGQTLGGENLDIQGMNTKTKLNQQQEGLSGLENLYGTNVRNEVPGLDASNTALKDEYQAPQSFWQRTGQDIATQGIDSLLDFGLGKAGLPIPG
jgi:hypothetical protein